MMFTAHPDLMRELVNERIARLHAEADADRLARKFRAKRRPTLRPGGLQPGRPRPSARATAKADRAT
jgi:hypothetical protein